MKIIRMRPQGIQLPEITYVKNNKRIVIQGAIHIADSEFYRIVIDRIKGFPGETHLEGIITTDEKHKDRKELLNSLYTIMSAYGNIAYQKDHIGKNLVDNKKVFNYDLTDVEIESQIFNEETMKELHKSVKKVKEKAVRNSLLNLGSSPLFNILIASIGSSSNIKLDNEHIILDQRNKFAIEKALSTDKDVFLFWGAKHLEGMNDLLLDQGFTIERTKWKTALKTLRLQKNHHHRKNLILHHLNKMEESLAALSIEQN